MKVTVNGGRVGGFCGMYSIFPSVVFVCGTTNADSASRGLLRSDHVLKDISEIGRIQEETDDGRMGKVVEGKAIGSTLEWARQFEFSFRSMWWVAKTAEWQGYSTKCHVGLGMWAAIWKPAVKCAGFVSEWVGPLMGIKYMSAFACTKGCL